MPQYTLHLPDGTEYGPVDLATLQAWRQEGRIPKEALVWKEGTPDWVSADALLGGADEPVAAEPTAPVAAPAKAAETKPAAAAAPAKAAEAKPAASATAPARPAAANRRARPRAAAPSAGAPEAPSSSVLPRAVLLTVIGLVVVGSIVAGALAFMLPALQKRRAMAEIQRYALPDRTLTD